MTLSVFLACLAACQGADEPSDWLDWARAIDQAELTLKLGDFQAELSGELDLLGFFFAPHAPGVSMEEAAIRAGHYDPARKVSSPQMGGRFEMILDMSYQDWLEASIDARVDRAIASRPGEEFGARLEQYWLRATPSDQTAVHFQIGKFAAPFGSFIGRVSSDQNPLPTDPLPYDFVTTYAGLSDTAAKILARKDVSGSKEWRVPVWEEVYAHGAMVFGNLGDLRYAAAVMNSAPATFPYDWELHTEDYRIPSIYLRASYTPDISSKLGASFARGPYTKWNDPSVPPGRHASDFDQTAWGLDYSFSSGHFELFAEGIVSRLETPLAGDLHLWTFYIEPKYTFLPGFYGALRFGQIRFGTVRDPSGDLVPWDHDTTRLEAGGGYFFTRNFFVKAGFQFNKPIGGSEPSQNMLTVEVVLKY
jgi:hypothetical protein